MPNTFLMQELVRSYFDENLDREDEGKQVETPYIYTISKGRKAFLLSDSTHRQLTQIGRDTHSEPSDSDQ